MKKIIICLSLVLAVSACSVNKKSLGLGRQDPDEFVVIKRQPLSVPPQYNITPPEPGKRALKEVNPEEKAEEALFGEITSSESISSDDVNFLKSINADSSKSNIRETLNEELHNDPVNNKYLIDNIMFWKDKDNSVIIDNLEESKRLQHNKQQGVSVDSGEVPIIEPKN